MVKSKMANILLVFLLALILVGVAALVILNQFTNETLAEEDYSLDQLIERAYTTEDIITNLNSNNGYIKASFYIQLNSKEAVEELEKRDFQVNNLIIHTLSEINPSELSGSTSIEEVELQIQSDINDFLSEGEAIKVYATSWVIQ
ncbi:flagellar basal body-associated protein FliL [Alkalihalobacillus trypoxylicola]|uniref:Flagellar protein FliL n=1 Tax=Alkalihalobacillus trypoxylicola TaxID=519424 RepID=A0A162F8N4_9BACI|nr:flagellar basal body-associated protein FliL [Alkalihalobacillus trypoxylicola]KYG35050.1 flagellar basal body-associated protein FliL [Alkalihalobacillus trypoxylicola]